MLVSPAEPHAALKALGRSSPLPERFGVDFLWTAHGEFHGVQRKAVNDLLASVADDRLTRELGQMQRLAVRIMLIEGPINWTGDGEMVGGSGYGRPWNRRAWEGLLVSIQARGVWLTRSASVQDSALVIGYLHDWTTKRKHHASHARTEGPATTWGKPTHADFQRYLLQGLPGVGVELAGRIVEKFGRVPWKWDVTMEELMEVDGIGEKKAKAMMEAFG